MTMRDKFHEGLRLQHGISVDADPAAAAECFRCAGAEGHTPALVHLGVLLIQEGELYPRSLEEAAGAFQRAAEGGNPRALFHLALGPYKRKQIPEAIELFQKAADLGELASLLYLGDGYASGVGLPRDLQKAFGCYLDGALAGQVDHTCNLAHLVRNEQEFHSFAALVHDLLEPGRQLENPRAWLETGFLFQSQLLQAEDNATEAFRHVWQAVEIGMTEADAWCGDSLIRGYGCKQNLKEGRRLLDRAMAQGSPEAKLAVAGLHMRGIGVKRDSAKTFLLTKELAESGHTKSQRALAWMYREAVGTEQDLEAATYWNEQLACLPKRMRNASSLSSHPA